VVEEERAVEGTPASQVALGPPDDAGSGGEDVVMVPAYGGSAPPPPAREHDIATPAEPESTAVVTAEPTEGASDTSSSRYVNFPGVGIIDLDATELPSNDRELLEIVTERMFADPSILDAIALVSSVSRQDEGVVGSAPRARGSRGGSRGVHGRHRTGCDRAPANVGRRKHRRTAAPARRGSHERATPSVLGTIEGVVGGAGPSSPQPAAAVVEVVPVPSQPVAPSQECDSPEGTTRVASPEIQEAEENTGAALPQGAASAEAQVLELTRASWTTAFEVGDDPRTTRRPQRATHLSAGWRGRVAHSMSRSSPRRW
jgi:hypothetical protein